MGVKVLGKRVCDNPCSLVIRVRKRCYDNSILELLVCIPVAKTRDSFSWDITLRHGIVTKVGYQQNVVFIVRS